MKKMRIGALLLSVGLFMSCSTSEIADPNESATPEVNPSQLNFKTIDLDFITEKGASSSETRSAGDVDEFGRPKGEYPLNNVFLFSITENIATGVVESKVSKKMDIMKSSKIAYAFIDGNGNENENEPTHVYITPAATKKDPSTGVVVKLSTLVSEMKDQMNMNEIIAGDLFYYDSTDQKEERLPKAHGKFCNELGDILFRSAQYYLVFDKTERTLVAFKRDKNYQMVFPVNDPGTEAGGLWPIRVNRTGAALTIRYMITGDYYNENSNDATATAFEKATGFPMNSVYSEQAYIGNFPSAFDTEKDVIIDPSTSENRCDLLIYDTNKKVTEMTKILFKYAESSQEIIGMGLATAEVPFVYPMIFGIANSFHITVGINFNGKDVKMNFQVSSSESQYSLTANTNTIFYLKMTAKELGNFYQTALNSNKTRSSGIATFELPSSALEVVQLAY